jgi:uncharacterized membrane protein
MGVAATTVVLVVNSWKVNKPGVTLAIALGAMATVEIGEIIKKAKEHAIKIDIKIGCKVVKVLIKSPISC